MSIPPKWGIVSTIKAPLRDIAGFAAHHLELGAHRLLLYLDDDNQEAFTALKAHPKIRVFKADPGNWRSANRPDKHQARQSANARHALHRKSADIAWLAHIDVDEFLWPDSPLSDQLHALPDDCLTARMRPVEALSGEGIADLPPGVTAFKAMAQDRKLRAAQTEVIYPTYGAYLNGGFLSHVAGKIFVRTGIEGLSLKIHNARLGEVDNPGQQELSGTEICHLHAPSLDDWLARFDARLARGAYRAELAPNRPRDRGGMTLHDLFQTILSDTGRDGLAAFYDEVCRASPGLRARLSEHGLLRLRALDLDAKRAKHFPALT